MLLYHHHLQYHYQNYKYQHYYHSHCCYHPSPFPLFISPYLVVVSPHLHFASYLGLCVATSWSAEIVTNLQKINVS